MTDYGTLFIGGSHDGERHCIHPSEYRVSFPAVSEGDRYGHENYRRHEMQASNGLIRVFVAEELSLHEAVVRLIENYRPIEKECREHVVKSCRPVESFEESSRIMGERLWLPSDSP